MLPSRISPTTIAAAPVPLVSVLLFVPCVIKAHNRFFAFSKIMITSPYFANNRDLIVLLKGR